MARAVGGWADQWRQGTLAVRGLGHVGAAAVALGARPSGRRWPVVAALGGSLAVDVALARRAGTKDRSRVGELVANAADLAVWGGLVGPGRAALRPAVVATIVPTAIETGFRRGAGVEAVPVMEPALPWEPAWDPPLPRLLSLPWSALGRSGGVARLRSAVGAPPWPRIRWTRAASLVVDHAADIAPPMVAAAAARRALGGATAPGLVGWGAFGAIGGYALARTRDDAQRSTRQVWHRRCDEILEEQRITARTLAALAHNLLAVDPRSLLRTLAAQGSEPALDALRLLDEATRDIDRVAAGAEGTTLLSGVEHRTVVPREDRFRFVTNAQVGAIRRWLEEVEATEGSSDEADEADEADGSDGIDEPIEVVATDGRDLTLRYGGRSLALVRPTPELAIRLEPTLPAIAVGSVWTALSAVPSVGAGPVPAVAAALGLQAAAGWRLATRTALERRPDRATVVLLTTASVLVDVAVGRHQRTIRSADGLAICPGTGATQPLALLLAASWDHLGPERWVALVAGASAWAFSLLGAGHRRRSVLACELAFLLMPAAAAATMAADARREAAVLDDHLDRWLAHELEAEARTLAGVHVARYATVLETVAEELGRHDLGLDGDDVAEIRASYGAEARRLRSTDPLDVINW